MNILTVYLGVFCSRDDDRNRMFSRWVRKVHIFIIKTRYHWLCMKHFLCDDQYLQKHKSGTTYSIAECRDIVQCFLTTWHIAIEKQKGN